MSEIETQIYTALTQVLDPELHKPITDLKMVDGIVIDKNHNVLIKILLTTAGCPLRNKIETLVKTAVLAVKQVKSVKVELGVMNSTQLSELKAKLREGKPELVIPFAQPDSLTRVFCIASGKGGVGKSSITVNLAAALTQLGRTVGIIDADIYGHSIPDLLGSYQKPTKIENMIVPPAVSGIKNISINQFIKTNSPVIWRGPMLHRALQQFLVDVYWGDLDILLLDLPPGTGDMAISVAQLLPNSEIIVVTTPQKTAAKVAERAGLVALQTRQRLVGVIENMSGYQLPDGKHANIFGAGGGKIVAESLSQAIGTQVPILGSIPLDPQLRETGDAGTPLVIADPKSSTSKVFFDIAHNLSLRNKSIIGRSLNINTIKSS